MTHRPGRDSRLDGDEAAAGAEDAAPSRNSALARGGVPTSTVRYFERRGLLAPDARASGQRRYTDESLRRLVFIGMLQDAGLSLDDIIGVLGAGSAEEWKAIARARLHVLDEQIAKLEAARAYLGGALLCRYDHPVTDCHIMGARSTVA